MSASFEIVFKQKRPKSGEDKDPWDNKQPKQTYGSPIIKHISVRRFELLMTLISSLISSMSLQHRISQFLHDTQEVCPISFSFEEHKK